jgi:hypothetical protein
VHAHLLPIAGIDDLREKREEILKQLKEDESEKNKIQQDVGDRGQSWQQGQ